MAKHVKKLDGTLGVPLGGPRHVGAPARPHPEKYSKDQESSHDPVPGLQNAYMVKIMEGKF